MVENAAVSPVPLRAASVVRPTDSVSPALTKERDDLLYEEISVVLVHFEQRSPARAVEKLQ